MIQQETESAVLINRRLLNVAELSAYLNLSISTIYTMVSQRRIPFVKMGRLTKFDLKKINEFITANTVEARQEKNGITRNNF
jgi:excisionase family DNA binding protein